MKNELVDRSGGILPLTNQEIDQVCQNPGDNNADERHRKVWSPFQKLPNVRKFRVILND